MNGADVTFPYSDVNLKINKTVDFTEIKATQFYLIFGNAYLKLISCTSTQFGICTGIEDDSSLVLNKYLPNDQFWIDGKCISWLW